ncbi:hypothetical protein [Halocalculus aciditolerans]|uniref:DUF5658 domain-containing protein n=1 Tax=Halocalculus aciditolerans TaxID=1383812 RepID=A0A830FME9_9EURY|nr:hypothetical protein [Halocalculus aciditolerans]GGL70185.1 hypothetical protein GCM10009039_30270 [Halocalculus aciditolerans]
MLEKPRPVSYRSRTLGTRLAVASTCRRLVDVLSPVRVAALLVAALWLGPLVLVPIGVAVALQEGPPVVEPVRFDVLRWLRADPLRADAVAILAVHGLADGLSTVLADSLGPFGSAESNPLVAQLLEAGPVATVVGLTGAAALVAAIYPRAAGHRHVPDWFGRALVLLGSLVVANNVAVALGFGV